MRRSLIFVAALATLGACNAVDSTASAPTRPRAIRSAAYDELSDAVATADEEAAKKKKKMITGPCDNPQAVAAINDNAPPEVLARLCGPEVEPK